MKQFVIGVVSTLAFIWVFIFFGGQAIDRRCVITKTKTAGYVIGKKGYSVRYGKDTRLVRAECSEFSRWFFARDVDMFKHLGVK